MRRLYKIVFLCVFYIENERAACLSARHDNMK